jgi:hypothetical protein
MMMIFLDVVLAREDALEQQAPHDNRSEYVLCVSGLADSRCTALPGSALEGTIGGMRLC